MEQEKAYGIEFKIRAVELGRKIGFKKAAAELGIDLRMLRGWSGHYKHYKNEDEMKLTEELNPPELNPLGQMKLAEEAEEQTKSVIEELESITGELQQATKWLDKFEIEIEQGKQSDCRDSEKGLLEEMRKELDRCRQAVSAQGQKISEHSSRIAILRFEMRELADKRGRLLSFIWIPIGMAAAIGAAALKSPAKKCQ